jgi:ribosomal protein S18 acetylase RimI-like enzyme
VSVPETTSAALAISEIADEDVTAVVDLWQRCGLTRPWNEPAADIALARRGANATILVGRRDDGAIVATALVGHDGHRGWVYYVAVDPAHQKKGFGRVMMGAAEDRLREAGIEKIMLMVRPENTGVRKFYESIGYGEQPRLIFAKWLDGRPLTR